MQYDISATLAVEADYDSMNEKEKALADLVSEVLRIDKMGLSRDSDFFRIGGDSITAISLSSKAKQSGFDLATRDIFTKRKLGAIAEKITQVQLNETPAREIAIRYFNV
jgi:aryl carrier-like protein